MYALYCIVLSRCWWRHIDHQSVRARPAPSATRAVHFRAVFVRVTNSVHGSRKERLPPVPCVVVANHASYIDGIIAIAALPPTSRSSSKKKWCACPRELIPPAIGLRIRGALQRHQGASDARRYCVSRRQVNPWFFFPKARSMSAAASANSWAAHLRRRNARTCRSLR